MLYALLTRTLLDINVLHDRNPVAVKLSDGSIRNAYTVRLLNKRGFDRVIAIDVDGPVNATLHVVGADSVTPDRPMIVLARDQTTELRLLVTAPAGEQSREIDPGAFPRHRYRPRRGRLRHRQFRVAMTASRRCSHEPDAVAKTPRPGARCSSCWSRSSAS